MSTGLYLGIGGGILLLIIIIVAVMMMNKKNDENDENDEEETTPTPSTPTPSTPTENNPSSVITSTDTLLSQQPLLVKSTRPVCAISIENQLFCMDQATNNNWIKVNKENAKHIAIDEQTNMLYLVQQDNKLFSSKIPTDGKYDRLVWKQLTGLLKQISANNNLVCGVNDQDQIFCGTPDTNGNITFSQVGGSLKHISVAANKGLHGANANDSLFYQESYPGTWKQNIGSAKQIDAISVPKACVVNSNNHLFCALGGTWARINPDKNFKYVTTSSSDEVIVLDQYNKPQYNDSYNNATPNWTELPTTTPSLPGKALAFKQIDF
jgi:hypothetical protein